jgi:hypothetical protein
VFAFFFHIQFTRIEFEKVWYIHTLETLEKLMEYVNFVEIDSTDDECMHCIYEVPFMKFCGKYIMETKIDYNKLYSQTYNVKSERKQFSVIMRSKMHELFKLQIFNWYSALNVTHYAPTHTHTKRVFWTIFDNTLVR